MKKIILIVALALTPFLFGNVSYAKPSNGNVSYAKPNNENTQYSKHTVQKQQVIKKRKKKKHIEQTSTVVTRQIEENSSEQTASQYWASEKKRQEAAGGEVNTKVADAKTTCGWLDFSCKRETDARVNARQHCGWFTCTSEVYQEAKKWEGKSAKGNRQELKALMSKDTPVDPTRTPWCAGFVNAILNRTGREGTGSLQARSFLALSHKTKNPKVGDIVILKRGKDPSAGHVGFFEGYEYFEGVKYVKVFGGNTAKSVQTGYFPITKVLGYRSVA